MRQNEVVLQRKLKENSITKIITLLINFKRLTFKVSVYRAELNLKVYCPRPEEVCAS